MPFNYKFQSPSSKNLGNLMTDRSNLKEDSMEKKSLISSLVYKQKLNNLNK